MKKEHAILQSIISLRVVEEGDESFESFQNNLQNYLLEAAKPNFKKVFVHLIYLHYVKKIELKNMQGFIHLFTLRFIESILGKYNILQYIKIEIKDE
jgi:hypothetical protein